MGPTLETSRLILRPPEPQDFEAFVAFGADEEVMRHLGGVQTRMLAWRSFMTMAGAWAMSGFSMFSVIDKASGRWLGRLGPWRPADWPAAEVGWGLAREAWGKGYATEGASAAIDWAFDHLGWTEVGHCIAPENTGSQNVAKRLGSRILRDVRLPAPYDQEPIQLWGQTREEWRARKR
jgi:RimJ/RimL family protein N-acetyltransferase